MHVFDALILGLVQGLTEFLPISSTGHLILAREVFGYAPLSGLAFDALLHLATAGAVALYFRKDLAKIAYTIFALLCGRPTDAGMRTMVYALTLGTVPAVIAGLFLERTMEAEFRSASLVAWVLLIGSCLFLVAEYVGNHYTTPRIITPCRGFLIGLFQAIALIPGMSRSGATISGGLLMGLSREEAARFGFLLSFPVIVGAGGKKIVELTLNGQLEADLLPIIVGTLSAFIAGLIAIHWLIRYLHTHTLLAFVLYRVVVASAVLLLV